MKYLSKAAVLKLRNLAHLGKCHELSDVIYKAAANLKIRQKSLDIVIPKMCAKINNYDLAYELLEAFDTEATGKYLSSLKISCAQIVNECIAEQANFQTIWKCFERLDRMGGHLDVVSQNELLKLCASRCLLDHFLRVAKHRPITESALVIGAEPFILSGRVADYTSMLKELIYKEKTIADLESKLPILLRVISNIFFAKVKRSISVKSHISDAEFKDTEYLMGLLNYTLLQGRNLKGDISLLHATRIAFRHLERVHKMIMKAQRLHDPIQLSSEFLLNEEVPFEITGFPFLVEDTDVLRPFSQLCMDLSSQPAARANGYQHFLYSSHMLPGNIEGSLVELGLNRNMIRPAREYYGSKLPHWILSPLNSASVSDQDVGGDEEGDDDDDDDDDGNEDNETEIVSEDDEDEEDDEDMDDGSNPMETARSIFDDLKRELDKYDMGALVHVHVQILKSPSSDKSPSRDFVSNNHEDYHNGRLILPLESKRGHPIDEFYIHDLTASLAQQQAANGARVRRLLYSDEFFENAEDGHFDMYDEEDFIEDDDDDDDDNGDSDDSEFDEAEITQSTLAQEGAENGEGDEGGSAVNGGSEVSLRGFDRDTAQSSVPPSGRPTAGSI